MKYVLVIEVEVDEAGLGGYWTQYPNFADEHPAQTLYREAVCQWDSEGLIVPGSEILRQGEEMVEA